MKDRVSFNIKNNRINFKFQIERNVTIISGDSGTASTPGLEYSKKRLAKGYTSDANVEKIINATKKK